ncbi:MAG TPA: polyprenyl diphosphate synthase [Mycobacteriales bacterium]|nr:polyprenyl diphosphate synthase [Mycobacteriales bacterium]
MTGEAAPGEGADTDTDAVAAEQGVMAPRSDAGRGAFGPWGQQPPSLPSESLPQHVAIITDGNRRWAIGRGLTPLEGQRAGQEAFINIVRGVVEIGLPYLTVYGFSTENWSRTPHEVASIMQHLPHAARQMGQLFRGMGVRFRWLGRRDRVGSAVAEELARLEDLTQHNRAATVMMCVDYGGRAEIAGAANAIVRDVVTGRLAGGDIDEAVFARYLPYPDLPDVDLLIRTGGQQRTSNFLPWQAAYAELYFTDIMWPDFDRRALWCALETYINRTRTFGADAAGGPPSPPAGDSELSTVTSSGSRPDGWRSTV